MRRKTSTVKVGNILIGSEHPIRIQSMTNSSTRDVEATVEQIIKLADNGCEIARVTVQGIKEAEACEQIKNLLVQKGYTIPLVADIHFFPPAAMHVADFVEKIRINPGNFADKRASFREIEYTDASYAEKLERIEEKFTPLVLKCKKLGRAMRIGTNHGSLSDRIMNRYGDTPAGMVESAFEYTRICRKHDYHNLLYSMKSSNPKVMIESYRLLVEEMDKEGWNYPLHLGVTEAGEGEDGRIKSAMGIGTLLLDGIGDTIRVSLTEDPWEEIDPCKRLVAFANDNRSVPIKIGEKRAVHFPSGLPLHRDGTVVVPLKENETHAKDLHISLGCEGNKLTRSSADALFLNGYSETDQVKALREIGVGTIETIKLAEAKFQVVKKSLLISDEKPSEWEELLCCSPSLIFLAPKKDRLNYARQFFAWLKEHGIKAPVILNFSYDCSKEDVVIGASAECGALLADGLGEGLCLETPHEADFIRQLSFNLLQAARMRTVKTEFISCPSCGRTLFDLQDVTKRIREKTAHLPGVKIAIMGCIVNGPGEMADADFGYVGSRPGMIDLYVGKERVEKNIDFADADDRLIDLIKAHDRWVEPA